MDNYRTIPREAPGKLPILGHLLLFRNDPYKFLQKNCAEMGNIFSFQLLNRNFYVLNHPDLIKHVLIVNAKIIQENLRINFWKKYLAKEC
ncbi:MAG: cytochrome P450 [Ignavibacteria bacterium]|nr:cytochrome P450 [Ignavibacteria bacterium]